VKAIEVSDAEAQTIIEAMRERLSRMIEKPAWTVERYQNAARWHKRNGSGNVRATIILEAEMHEGQAWWHLSFSFVDRMPTWPEMAEIKDWILGTSSTAVQVAPPRAQYVNINPNVLHLFTRLDGTLPLPDFRREDLTL